MGRCRFCGFISSSSTQQVYQSEWDAADSSKGAAVMPCHITQATIHIIHVTCDAATFISRNTSCIITCLFMCGCCRAISDTPFPFPWAQMVLVMLLLYAITAPLVVVAFVDSMWMGIVVNFICIQSYWCLNEVARDLEDPFVYDPNDLPLSTYQVWPLLLDELHTLLHAMLCCCTSCIGCAYCWLGCNCTQ